MRKNRGRFNPALAFAATPEQTEAWAHEDGLHTIDEEQPVTVDVPEYCDVRSLRKRLKLTQTEFAEQFGLSPRTVQEWEQLRRVPDGPALMLLRLIAAAPHLVSQVADGTFDSLLQLQAEMDSSKEAAAKKFANIFRTNAKRSGSWEIAVDMTEPKYILVTNIGNPDTPMKAFEILQDPAKKTLKKTSLGSALPLHKYRAKMSTYVYEGIDGIIPTRDKSSS